MYYTLSAMGATLTKAAFSLYLSLSLAVVECEQSIDWNPAAVAENKSESRFCDDIPNAKNRARCLYRMIHCKDG